MEEILRFLEKNYSGALATVDNGKPKVRPFGLIMEENGKFYFCTANTKEVYAQLIKTPFAEFTATSQDMVTIRLSGEITFTTDIGMKKRVLEKFENVRDLYKSADNPAFEVFYIEHGEAVMSDFSGRPPRKICF